MRETSRRLLKEEGREEGRWRNLEAGRWAVKGEEGGSGEGARGDLLDVELLVVALDELGHDLVRVLHRLAVDEAEAAAEL